LSLTTGGARVKRLLNGIWTAGLALVASAAMAAQVTPMGGGGYQPKTLWDQVLSTVVFSMVGIALAIIGFKLFDLAIKFDIEREICEKNNLAAAVLAGAVVLGTCIIVAVVVIS
jgi:putative membrane protein